MIPYNKFRYVFPPRAENALPESSLLTYDNGTYIAQPKLNGDCMLVFTNGIETIVMDRHKKEFSKTIKMMPTLRKLHRETASEKTGDQKNKWMILVGEHMAKSKKNAEGKTWNDKFVIFDIIAYDNMQLIGKSFEERQELLDRLFGKEEIALLKSGGTYTDKFLYATEIEDVFRVKSYRECFSAVWKDLIKIDMYEGLVLKRAKAELENGSTQSNNINSQMKFRKPTKNYAY
jgi:hypothetical protein